MAIKVSMSYEQQAELAKVIANGLARNPEFIKSITQYNGTSQIGYQIAEHTKAAVEGIVR